jgi:hypothetical protein
MIVRCHEVSKYWKSVHESSSVTCLQLKASSAKKTTVLLHSFTEVNYCCSSFEAVVTALLKIRVF